MQQSKKRSLIKYGVILSILNLLLITSALVLYDLYYDGKCDTAKVEKEIAEKVVKKREVVKKKPQKSVPKRKRTYAFDTKKRKIIKKICIINTHKPECRKPDITSMPAELKEYYNYDPINRVWVWSGGK